MLVLLSLKDYSPDLVPAGVDADALVSGVVSAFRSHPALLGWYLTDEVKTVNLTPSRAAPSACGSSDPSHITFALLDNALAPAFAARPADFRNLSQLLGTDPHDFVNSSFTTNLSNEVANLRNMQQGFETLANGASACFEVTQMQLYFRAGTARRRRRRVRASIRRLACCARWRSWLPSSFEQWCPPVRVLSRPRLSRSAAAAGNERSPLEHAHAWSAAPRGAERAARSPARRACTSRRKATTSSPRGPRGSASLVLFVVHGGLE